MGGGGEGKKIGTSILPEEEQLMKSFKKALPFSIQSYVACNVISTSF